jgi:hypothetical protein
MNPKLALVLICIASPVWAQTAPAPAAGASAASTTRIIASDATAGSEEHGLRSEPNVRHILIEDEGSKIEELRVRGRTEHIVVTPKVGTTKPYEILVAPGGRDLTEGTGGARSAVGKRVWSILNF